MLTQASVSLYFVASVSPKDPGPLFAASWWGEGSLRVASPVFHLCAHPSSITQPRGYCYTQERP